MRLGKWPAMAPLVRYLPAYLYPAIVTMAPLDAAIRAAAGSLMRARRDPFDRLIAATALQLGCPWVSSDAAFDGVVQRVG